MGGLCPRGVFSLAEILVLAGTTDAVGMAPPNSTRISAMMECIQKHSSPVNTFSGQADSWPGARGSESGKSGREDSTQAATKQAATLSLQLRHKLTYNSGQHTYPI